MEYLVDASKLNRRLDIFVSSLDVGLSRSQACNLIRNNDILVNDKASRPSYKLKINDKVSVNIPRPKELKTGAEDISLDIIYEDSDIIVINKPRGMVVHPGAGNYSGTLVNALLYHCKDLSGIGGVLRPGIVHRLDKDTSGVIIAAKSDEAHKALSRQFKNRTIKKIYLALVKGIVKEDSGVIDVPIGRHPVNRKKMDVASPQKKQRFRKAITHYKVIKKFKDVTLLEIEPKTGRTHQIRVHLASIGHPVVGDVLYGGSKYKAQSTEKSGQLLHAKSIRFMHPTTGKYVEFEADVPEDMKSYL
ncbi:RNA pseudouridine synthase [candidate division WOR-1 bacterium RIFOXYD2_FULL_36_8]|uniref:Pseudouridine synthase n=1 Tax=candidate division WOR-1 bacterium RIFOXYB2_FULL_36_35 TaxID=1802578 RepID=A0A1F4S295_UNCSA|nr:MAG: RNA pseudouridine synthase [candidate division WOR-1 bacterium RIFOXYA2_FULL_36_21]OGC14576.1 MAG: RNA pseudouridine synthase [candidate division WOR-1 bacterium RIFOXYB2_FULL_36_35]OGC16248.1 MAG: RNA pseudouridine synthase [candidate division WOR-1 bacterium RIFOXYA12_FULL_36_13]OGC41803.1 MAG: RNA pseudouridine synthase [candidate division WOR-1 bacterium RIFOXYD2_FULL_36_8]